MELALLGAFLMGVFVGVIFYPHVDDHVWKLRKEGMWMRDRELRK